ncbi:NERD domain-containing protein [Pseudarthrobacter psychrotolerans]|uniref:NERD domain-containing protein n=1 Tax=Pseudarthrobacter psychrotolerans TaxID=2697569 RepID=A0A6P1NQZ7_9MICC|nr:nuclease-related domain-containing protein [Pseudarthrobacter psychrotolerans]QHK21197.1 NERD domain-containing protein [Pseudarthrobacter psychrotolerans]
MAAGDGAAEQSRLAAERVQRLKRQLDLAERATKSWDAGVVGERLVTDRLSGLIPHGWYLLNDVHWPGRPKANLDHVLVGPGGVVVVDAKNWTGEVTVSAGVLWQGRFARTQSVDGALAQCAAVASVLAPPHRRFVRPLICLAGQPDLFGITNSDVAVAGVDHVVAAVLALPPVLDQQTVVGLYAHLGEQLAQDPAAEGPAQDSLTAKPLTAKPPSAKSSTTRLPTAKPVAGRTPAAGPAVAGPARSGQAGGRQGPRQLTHGPGRGARSGAGSGGAARSRNSRAQQHAAGGMTRLMFLAAFVVFAVYVLPYWGR